MRYLKKINLVCVSFTLGLSFLAISLPAQADRFLGVEVKPTRGNYLVTKDVNVRALPKTASKRLSGLKKGEKVQGAGNPKDAAWIAVRLDGKDLGFVYAPVLLPLLDGKIENEIAGKTDVGNGRQCIYNIRFEAKSQVDGELFEIADYEVSYVCTLKGATTKFSALMFMTEAPFIVSKSFVHQITIDLQSVADEIDDVLSTNFLLNLNKKVLFFDSVSLTKLGKKPAFKSYATSDLKSALKIVAEVAPSLWTEVVWKNLKNPKL